MIIDCHAHYEPRIMNIENLLKKMDGAGISKTALIPLLTDPPETKKPDLPMAIQRFMLNSQVLRPLAVFITKSMYRKKGQWNIWYKTEGGRKFNIVQSPDNQSVAEVVSRHPDHLLGWIFINPLNDNALQELEKWQDVKGMIGVKIHPFWHQFPVEKVEKLASRAQELRLPLLVHLGYGSSGNYMWLIEHFPKLKIIFAHLGIPFYKKLWPVVTKSPNVFMDISSTYHVNERFVRQAVKAVGPHKCLFGTDMPYAHEDSVFRIKKWVENLKILDREKEMIFSGNFMGLVNG